MFEADSVPFLTAIGKTCLFLSHFLFHTCMVGQQMHKLLDSRNFLEAIGILDLCRKDCFIFDSYKMPQVRKVSAHAFVLLVCSLLL